MKRDEKKNPVLSNKTTHWCCEDYFSELYYVSIGRGHGELLAVAFDKRCQKIKAVVVPHRFECQKKTPCTQPERKGALKRRRIALVQEGISAAAIPSAPTTPSTSVASYCDEEHLASVEDKAIHVKMVKPFRSKSTNTDVPNTKNVACSPIKMYAPNPILQNACSGIQPDKFEIEEVAYSDSASDIECPEIVQKILVLRIKMCALLSTRNI
ncbi:hypothetical protein JTE90_028972 [Oedothorax gibbosus]|uniref:Uncharacterized protein n=1 Tax=Oedothorax gibbosus TaxID=931172 RepID=A0AAV6VKC4_9ARAC|nr:hypothetical protein JTE90_028972 [Oedothorax gibbosus]